MGGHSPYSIVSWYATHTVLVAVKKQNFPCWLTLLGRINPFITHSYIHTHTTHTRHNTRHKAIEREKERERERASSEREEEEEEES